MMKIEQIYRELLYQALEQKTRKLTQLGIARKLKVSLSTVNHALKPLREMGAVVVKRRHLIIQDPEKILYYWASARNLRKDILYQTRAEKPVRTLEKEMPAGIVFGAYTAYKYLFDDVPADYSEVYVYSDEQELREIKKRFPENKKTPNLFVLKKDAMMRTGERTTTIAHTFVDLWNLKEWYARDFIDSQKKRIEKMIPAGAGERIK